MDDQKNSGSNSGMDFEDGQGSSTNDISFYRELTQAYIDKLDFANAAYWADKVVTFSHGSQQDVYTLSKCFFHNGEYLRAANTLRFWKYENVNLYFRCFYAKCWYMVRDYNKALAILDSDCSKTAFHRPKVESQWEPFDPRKTIMSEFYLMKGNIYSAQLNRSLAMENYRKSLEHDIYCHEAFKRLTEHGSKTSSEVLELVKHLPFSESCANKDAEVLKYLYIEPGTSNLSDGIQQNPLLSALNGNSDVLTAKAEKYLKGRHIRKAYELAKKVIQQDPFHLTGLSVLIACQVHLKMTADLFRLSHKLVDTNPDSCLSWYSVGAYYYVLGNQEMARINLNKALTFDPVYGPAWLLFGHSFAVEHEHDQAMAAYFKGSKLMRGSHLPLLHGAVECALTNNMGMALRFLSDASAVASSDPLILHETGVILFHQKKYQEAYNHLKECENAITCSDSSEDQNEWEALFNNLGHCCRKLQMYPDALKYHRKALALNPTKYSSYSAIGFLYAIEGENEKACDVFHIALSQNRDDAFSNAMLSIVLDKIVSSNDIEDEEIEENEDSDSLSHISSILLETDCENFATGRTETNKTNINNESSFSSPGTCNCTI